MNCRSIVSMLALVVGACASPQGAKPVANLPDKLRPNTNESLAMIVAAKGVQIYDCRAAKDQPGVYEWQFVAPEADLFDASGKRIGKHYAGPRWESSDGSTIAGTAKERSDAPQADAIPWLLLATKTVGTQGAFSKVTSVQRVNTVGGTAPKTGCTPSAVGTSVRIPYFADYYFWTERSYYDSASSSLTKTFSAI
jgi:Protein of unknown function (DUF3455)